MALPDSAAAQRASNAIEEFKPQCREFDEDGNIQRQCLLPDGTWHDVAPRLIFPERDDTAEADTLGDEPLKSRNFFERFPNSVIAQKIETRNKLKGDNSAKNIGGFAKSNKKGISLNKKKSISRSKSRSLSRSRRR